MHINFPSNTDSPGGLVGWLAIDTQDREQPVKSGRIVAHSTKDLGVPTGMGGQNTSEGSLEGLVEFPD